MCFEKNQNLFVRIKSIQLDFSGFLKHAGCLMRLFLDSTSCRMSSWSDQRLKSPISMKL